MTVKEILKNVAIIINRLDIFNYLDKGISENYTKVMEDVNTLVSCYNIISEEIATEFYKFKNEENINVSNGVIEYSDFKYNPIAIISVKNTKGVRVKAKVLPTCIHTFESEVVVEYYYVPSVKNLDDISNFTNTPIKKRVLSYGIATEFLLITGAYEEASLWHEKYVDSLKNSLSKTKVGKVIGRVWK